jgi:hypothetical protein
VSSWYGLTKKDCGDIKDNPQDIENHEALQEENRRNCYNDGYENCKNCNLFDKDRDSGCSEYNSSYETGFSAACQSVEGNTKDSCKLTIEVEERYCPNNPDNLACTEFPHDAGNKQPPEGGICALPQHRCFKDQDPEKYCLNHNDPVFCKSIGDICDTDGFVKPEDAYCASNHKSPYQV